MRTTTAALLLCIAMIGTLGMTTGCAGKLDKATRAQAATDFKCTEDKVQVRRDEVYGKYHVDGCGQKGVYSAQCLLGKCSAERLRGE